MSRWVRSIALKLREAANDRRGVTALVVAVTLAGLVGATGFAVDVGVVLNARQALQANTNAAVLNAVYTWDQPGGTQADAVSAAQGWGACSPSPCIVTHPVPMVSGVTATASAVCVTNTSGLPSCGTGGANAISLTQTATVPTYFITVLGFKSWTVSAKATAVYAGGPAKALNVMFVLDTTKSMGTTTDDTGCTVPGISSPTRLDCAMYGVQLILKQLNPQIDKVGLMVFPGMKASWTACNTEAQSNIVPYGTTGIIYQVNGSTLSTDYASPMGTLNHSSNLVKAVGDSKNSFTGCLPALGGEGTFYAQAISAAQTALQSEGSSTAQNVIILLSDGEANVSLGSSDMDAAYQTTPCSPSSVCSYGHIEQQCNQAVANGETASGDGTWVYVIAYDAGGSGTGCPSQSVTTGTGKSAKTTTYYDSPTGTSANQWTPCSTLQNIASEAAKFYSTNSSCTSVNTYADVATQFQQAGVTLSQPRLVLD